MSSIPLTFNNGQTSTTSEIVVVAEGGRKRPGERGKSYLVTNLVKDGADKNNRPLYKREIYSFDSVSDAKSFQFKIDNGTFKEDTQAAAQSGGSLIATGSTKDGVKSFEYTNNAEDWQKTKSGEKQIKNASSKQVENIGRDEGGEVRNHTTEFSKKKVGDAKDDSIDAAENELETKKKERSGIGRKKYDNLFYPSFIKKSNQDKLRISILKPKLQVSSEGSSNRRDRFQAFKTRGEGVRLPYDIPKGAMFYSRRGQLVGYGEAEAFERNQDRIYARGDNQNKPEFNKEIIGSVTLPIPNGVTDQNALNFGVGTLNPAQK